MTSPYTHYPLDALMAAQSSVGLALSAVLLGRQVSRWAKALLLLGIWMSVLLPVMPDLLIGMGDTPGPKLAEHWLAATAAVIALSTLFSLRLAPIAFGLIFAAGLYWATGYVVDSPWELAAAHLAFAGAVVGIFSRERDAPPVRQLPVAARPRADWILFAVATALAVLVCSVVLERFTNSGDEWAYTFQSAVFAKGRAWAPPPACSEALRSFWVFEWSGKQFSQYTPGWPYFMVPFTALRAPWLAGPFAFGFLAVGVARLSRRATAELGGSAREVSAAGWVGGMSVALGSSYLLNGASRYPHVFVAAVFAWCVEALFEMTTSGASSRTHLRAALIVGILAALLPAIRPPDGFALGIGLFAYYVYALARRRISARAVAVTAAGFLFAGGLTLIILRLQLGKWFTTGYSLSSIFYPWNHVEALGAPKPNELKWGLPLATGAYCWLPCAPALAFAGLARLRGSAIRYAVVFVLSFVPFLVFYSLVKAGRGADFGYGPRYALPTVVPMAVGGALLLAPALARRSGRTLFERGAGLLAAAALLVGVIRIVPLVYPYNYQDVQAHNRLALALRKADLHDALVIATGKLTNTNPMDLTENYPPALYDDDVIIAVGRSPSSERCLRNNYAGRTFYRAEPGPHDQVRLREDR